jgi:hypothetical protein
MHSNINIRGELVPTGRQFESIELRLHQPVAWSGVLIVLKSGSVFLAAEK